MMLSQFPKILHLYQLFIQDAHLLIWFVHLLSMGCRKNIGNWRKFSRSLKYVSRPTVFTWSADSKQTKKKKKKMQRNVTWFKLWFHYLLTDVLKKVLNHNFTCRSHLHYLRKYRAMHIKNNNHKGKLLDKENPEKAKKKHNKNFFNWIITKPRQICHVN